MNEQINWSFFTRDINNHLEIKEFKNKAEDKWNQWIHDPNHIFVSGGYFRNLYITLMSIPGWVSLKGMSQIVIQRIIQQRIIQLRQMMTVIQTI